MSARVAVLRGALAGIAFLTAGCSASEPEAGVGTPRPRQAPIDFAWIAPDGSVVGSTQTRGRVTVVLFITTYDAGSQMLAGSVDDLIHSHRPRINAVAVVLEPPKYAPLVEAFSSSLGLSYPVVVADRATREGRGPFERIRGVPTTVILDAAGRVAWRREGLGAADQLKEGLAKAEARGNAPRL